MGTIPTIPTFTAGAILTAAEMNAVKDASDFWALTPRCSVYQTATTSIANSAATGTVCAFDTEIYDVVQSGDTPMHDTSTNNHRVYIRTAGKYEISGQVQFSSNSTGFRVARIIVNSGGSYSGGTLVTESAQSAVNGGSTSAGCIPVEVDLSIGDYVEIWGLQNSGGALNTSTGQSKTFLRVKLAGS